MNCGSGSLWVRLSPPRPAIRNLRPADGMASNTVTPAPPCASTSAAINPAGPAPMTATWGWQEDMGELYVIPGRASARTRNLARQHRNSPMCDCTSEFDASHLPGMTESEFDARARRCLPDILLCLLERAFQRFCA